MPLGRTIYFLFLKSSPCPISSQLKDLQIIIHKVVGVLDKVETGTGRSTLSHQSFRQYYFEEVNFYIFKLLNPSLLDSHIKSNGIILFNDSVQ